MKPKDVRVLRVDCDHSENGKWRVHLLEDEWKALSESYDRIFQDRYDLLTVHTKEGMLASEWLMRTATAERERDQLRKEVESLKAQLECAQAFHDVAAKERDLARTQIASAMREREELNRLRRLTPTGTYTLNVAHEEALERMREALRAAEKRELEALAELDEERANVETLKTHVEALREAWQGASEAVAKLGEQLNASEADCERFGKLLDDCRDLLMTQYDPDDNIAMIRRIEDVLGVCKPVARL